MAQKGLRSRPVAGPKARVAARSPQGAPSQGRSAPQDAASGKVGAETVEPPRPARKARPVHPAFARYFLALFLARGLSPTALLTHFRHHCVPPMAGVIFDGGTTRIIRRCRFCSIHEFET